jgi:hypothetical protein
VAGDRCGSTAPGFFAFLVGNQIAHIDFARQATRLAGIPTPPQFLNVAGAQRSAVPEIWIASLALAMTG